ncbi:leucine-rich repeat-containing protein [Cavenderia fasciculata]|uniref:Leucine-rich repeat-containing protein n=1 Tax=Cavenderia fasciculata TaxID=261658 RepID=F4Q7Q9_CACFS|nr:leucine-rich repeat-containing protein [Cavenderia fasciculata]EGG15809.1 leucine-rich repeat-containing protein [Cavenderia fasciculata]|eukprot:XP_004352134.1 leucine-rich repeat-containing protein [Cavenderia fasciculata]
MDGDDDDDDDNHHIILRLIQQRQRQRMSTFFKKDKDKETTKKDKDKEKEKEKDNNKQYDKEKKGTLRKLFGISKSNSSSSSSQLIQQQQQQQQRDNNNNNYYNVNNSNSNGNQLNDQSANGGVSSSVSSDTMTQPTTTVVSSSISTSTSTSSSSLRSNSGNSLTASQQNNAANRRTESSSSINSNSSTVDYYYNNNNNNNNNTSTVPNTLSSSSSSSSKKDKSNSISNSNSNSNSTLKGSKGKLKSIYNSLRFKSLRGDKSNNNGGSSSTSSSSAAGGRGELTKSTSTHFEFATPISPLHYFDQQFPSIVSWMPNSDTYFGVPLSTLVKRQDNGCSIPVLVEKAISFLEAHSHLPNLFSNAFDSGTVRHLRQLFERNGDANFFYPQQQDPNDVAALLIEFLSSLPDELLNNELYSAINNHSSNSVYGGYWDIQFLVNKLPKESKEVVQRIFMFLKSIVVADKDSLGRLSTLFTPLLVNHKSHNLLYPATNMMIEKCEDLFVEVDDRPQTLPGEFIMLQINRVSIPPILQRITDSKPGTIDSSTWEVGTLSITNYRLFWSKNEDSISQDHFLLPDDYESSDNKKDKNNEVNLKPYHFEIILTSCIKWETLGKSKQLKLEKSKIQHQLYLLYCKDMIFQYFAFQDDYSMDKFHCILGYYISPVNDIGRFFANVNGELSMYDYQKAKEIFLEKKEKREKDQKDQESKDEVIIEPINLNSSTSSTNNNKIKQSTSNQQIAAVEEELSIYQLYQQQQLNKNQQPIHDYQFECTRLKLDQKEWKILEFSTRDIISPKKIIIPSNLVNDEILNSYVKKNSRIPVFTWIHPHRKSVLYRLTINSLVANPPNGINGPNHNNGATLLPIGNSNGTAMLSASLSSSTGVVMQHYSSSSSSSNAQNPLGISIGADDIQPPPPQINIQSSPHKRRNEKTSFSPQISIRSLAKGSSKKKDPSLGKLPVIGNSSTNVLSDSVDIKLFQMFVSRDVDASLAVSNPSTPSSSTSNSPILFSSTPQQQGLNSSNTSTNNLGNSINNNNSITNSTSQSSQYLNAKSTIVFTNKIDMNYISVFEQFKLNSNNMVFLNVSPREEVEANWHELYKYINMFDGSSESWRLVEDSHWIESVRLLVEGSCRVASLIGEGINVLLRPNVESPLHTFDLARITALVQIMMDPYYRTINGFIKLIEKEFIQFNFPFINLNNSSNNSGNNNNSSYTSNNNGNNTTNQLNNSLSGSGSIGRNAGLSLLSSSTSSTNNNNGSTTSSLSGSTGMPPISSSGTTPRFKKTISIDEKMNLFEQLSATLEAPPSMSKKTPALFTSNDSLDISVISRSLSPVFVQFLDAVWQIQRQFPFHFEFNEYMLLFIIKEAFTGRFGTFLGSEAVRDNDRRVLGRTPSVWQYINAHADQLFKNMSFKYTKSHTLSPGDESYEHIKPTVDRASIVLWSRLFGAHISAREGQQLGKRVIGRSKAEFCNWRLTNVTIDVHHLNFCRSLTHLDLSRNFLNSFPSELVLLGNLTHLSLADNRICSMPSAVLKLVGSKLKLIELNLANNLLDTLHKQVSTLTTLQRLILDGNRLVVIPESISKMSSLRVLSVENNRLTSFPQALSLMKGLEELKVAGNQIRDLPLGFFTLPNVRHVDLRLNLLAKFKAHKMDDRPYSMNSIECLKCGPNPLLKISNILYEMKTLRHLELTGCNLMQVPPRLLELVNLETLHLNQNKLTELPTDFCRLINLVSLDLSDNSFATLPASALLVTLRKLDLHNNLIFAFTFSAQSLPLIEDLRLDSNRLTYVSPSIGQLSTLTSLNLSKNNIATLPHTLGSLDRLKNLQITTTNMSSPFKEMGDTMAILRYLKAQINSSYYQPRGKLVIISDPTITSKNEIIRTVTSSNSKKRNNNQKNNNSNSNNSNKSPLSLGQRKIPKWEFDMEPDVVTPPTNSQSTNQQPYLNRKTNPNSGKDIFTVYIRDISSVISTCSQHLFTKRSVFLVLWTVQESEEPLKLYRTLEHIKDRCVTASIYIVGIFNEKDNNVTKDYYTYINAKVEQKCTNNFPNFTMSFHLIGNVGGSSVDNALLRIREDIKLTFTKQRNYGGKLQSSQRLFERHLKTLQSPFISKREIINIGDMCGLDKLGTKGTCDLLTELGLLLWLDDHEWVILDPFWLTTAFSSLITVLNQSNNNQQNNNNNQNNQVVLRKDIIMISSLETVWNDIPTRMYSFLLTLAKKYNIAFIIDTLFDPAPWGYTYGQQQNQLNHAGSFSDLRTSSNNGSPQLRSLNHSMNRNSPSSSASKLTLSPPSNNRLSTLISKEKLLLSPGQQNSSSNNNNNNSSIYGNLKLLTEKVIFLPGELPETPPLPIDTMFPIHEPRSVGRIFVFESKIPSSLFPRLLSQLYMFCSIKVAWRTGVVLDNVYLSFPIARRYPASPNNKQYRRSSTFSVLSSDDLVVIQVNEATQTIEISSTKMCRHILQTFDLILETYADQLVYKSYIPCIHCIDSKSRPDGNYHLFPIEQIEAAVVKGKSYVSCPHAGSIPIKLNQLAPDLTMTDIRHKMIDYNELELEPNPIGEGGTATVYKGTWRNNQSVAVKVLHTDKIGTQFTKVFNEFRREIFIMSSFYHPNILDLKGFCLEPLCIITEFMAGGNLYDYIHDSNLALEWPLKIRMAKEIASSLQTLHDCKPSMIHRDLKSPNILLSSRTPEDLSCQLCDFSLSGFSTSLSTRAVENPVWLAPEVISKEGCTDKSDVYSYGVILFEILSRQQFFGGISFMSNLEQMICDGIRPQLPYHQVSEFDALLNSCWHQDPSQRPSFAKILKKLDLIETLIIINKPDLPIHFDKLNQVNNQQSIQVNNQQNNNNNQNNNVISSPISLQSINNNNNNNVNIKITFNNNEINDQEEEEEEEKKKVIKSIAFDEYK